MKMPIAATAATLLLAVPDALAFDPVDLETFLATNECEGCDLNNAPLEALAGRDTTGARLAGADISNNFIREQTLDFADLTGATIVDSFLLESSAIGATFAHADMTDVGIEDSIMREADLTGAKMVAANIQDADFRGAILVGANLMGARITGAVFSGVDFTGANLAGATLDRSGVSEANFTDANLTGATVIRMSLSAAILCRTTMPDGSTNNRDCPRSAAGRQDVESIVMQPATGFLFVEQRVVFASDARDIWWNRVQLVGRLYSLGQLSEVWDVPQIVTEELRFGAFEPIVGDGFVIEVARDGNVRYAVAKVIGLGDEIELEWVFPVR